MEKLYLGFPQYIWDNLCQEAEDISFREFPGIFTVGIFPCGKRIHGLETEPAEILYLFVDTPDELLNPFHTTIQRQCFSVSSIGGNVYFYDLFSWIKDCVVDNFYQRNPYDKSTPSFYDLIPCFSNSLFLEDGVEPLIQELTNYILNAPQKSFDFSMNFRTILMNFRTILEYRTLAIWKLFKKFQPCIKSDWGKVFPLEKLIDSKHINFEINKELILKQEKELNNRILENDLGFQKSEDLFVSCEYSEYIDFLCRILRQYPIRLSSQKVSTEKIEQEVKKFYKALI